MKKILLLLMVSSLALVAFDGNKAYKKCAMCHGKQGQKIALKTSPRLNTLGEEEISEKLTAILKSTSKINKRYLGVHKAKLKGIEKENVAAFSKYISNLK